METATSLITNLFNRSERVRTCEVCGNEYDQCFEVHLDGKVHTFDCFECAIHALAPQCANCGCRVIGHGRGVNGNIYCCSHCARQHGVRNVEEYLEVERRKV